MKASDFAKIAAFSLKDRIQVDNRTKAGNLRAQQGLGPRSSSESAFRLTLWGSADVPDGAGLIKTRESPEGTTRTAVRDPPVETEVYVGLAYNLRAVSVGVWSLILLVVVLDSCCVCFLRFGQVSGRQPLGSRRRREGISIPFTSGSGLGKSFNCSPSERVRR